MVMESKSDSKSSPVASLGNFGGFSCLGAFMSSMACVTLPLISFQVLPSDEDRSPVFWPSGLPERLRWKKLPCRKSRRQLFSSLWGLLPE
uniref:Uncharacterized protein n=1 Tax=Lutzomyia longipalpis TaxID=7200 RepID=A0A7G3B6D1_LUTLO